MFRSLRALLLSVVLLAPLAAQAASVPGSITQQGFDPTRYVFVPVRVIGPGLSAVSRRICG